MLGEMFIEAVNTYNVLYNFYVVEQFKKYCIKTTATLYIDSFIWQAFIALGVAVDKNVPCLHGTNMLVGREHKITKK